MKGNIAAYGYFFTLNFLQLYFCATNVLSDTSSSSLCAVYAGNGYCDTETNNEDCSWDGGDCCECSCKDGSFECGSGFFECQDPTADCYDPLWNCNEDIESVGNGHCDPTVNTPECLYDGGDCCPCTCYNCSESDCLNPDAPKQVYDCEEPPADVPPCDNGVIKFEVENTSQARDLAEAAKCSGGTFEVSWNGNIIVDETIWVVYGTVLNVTGVGVSAEMDGNYQTRLLTVVDAFLHISNMHVRNGNGTGGGAVGAASSTLTFNCTMFTGNNASKDGGAVFASEGSILVFDEETKFLNNVASSGGGLYITGMSNASWIGQTNFTGNVGGATSVTNGSMVSWAEEVAFVEHTGDAALGVYDGCTAWWTGKATFVRNIGCALFVGKNSSATWSGLTTFTENNHAENGGAIYVEDGNVSWTGGTYFYNNSASSGGALFANGHGSISWAAATNFSGNIARQDGGAIYVEGGSISWTGTTMFSGNNAVNGGGAIAVSGGNVFWSNKTYFVANFLRDFETGVGQGGALFVSNRGHALWTVETVFDNNTAGDMGGGVFITHASTLTWRGETNFTSNKAGLHGGAVGSENVDRITTLSTDSTIASGEWSSIKILGRTNFIDNTSGGSGGGMALLGKLAATFSTPEVIFLRNSAGISGGGIFISATDDGPELDRVKFVLNSAASDGGGVYATGSRAVIDGCIFEDNTANEAGGAIDSVDGVDKIVNAKFRRNTAQMGGALMLSGTVEMSNCSFLENTSNVGSGPAVFNIGSVSKMDNCSFIENIFNCETSTYFSYNGEGNISDTICNGCNCDECSGCNTCYYGKHTNIPTCETALDHTKSFGGTIEDLEIDKGYWRSTNDSIDVLECYYAEACNGGVTGDPDYCKHGYEGAYCSVCSENYGPGLGNTCTKCSGSTGGIVLAIFLGTLGTAVGAILAIHLVSGAEGGRGHNLVNLAMRIIPLHTLKIIIVCWQILTQFSDVAYVTYPELYQRFLDVVDFVNFDLCWALAVECIVDVDFHSTLLVSTMAPLFILGFLGFTYFVAMRRHRHRSAVALQNIWQKHLSVVLLLTFLVYSSVSSVIFQMFNCEELDDGKIYLRADYSIECDSTKHRVMMVYSVCMVLLYPVGIPALYAYLLFSKRAILADGASRETNESVQLTMDLWKPYRPARFYYEVIECGRRLLLTGGVLLVEDDTSAQVAAILMVAVSFAILLEILAPYESRIDIWVSRTGHAVVYGSMYFALLQKTEISNDTQDSQMVFEWVLITTQVLMVVVVVINAIVLAYSSVVEKRMADRERVAPLDTFSGLEQSIWHVRVQPRACLNPRRQARIDHPS